ncbi:uncharacterized protein LOC104908333 isoform X2 [Beta vulgaris subsp. vulgaris]|uniref:uncharacterized protein LOC104908333 isoform X2 n=1 Tax=Beta vulgaris subsp. vulgaris TaxID=3555 RepID=UPI0020366AD2|nr:uncharacterized protein LOC104908333 isoform X2 [Beta vulgaris subsp. vulgaris]
MDDTGAILLQISTLKDMLDKVNDEIESNIQITREIESEIVKSEEIENFLAARESELMKLIYVSQFELSGLIAVTEPQDKIICMGLTLELLDRKSFSMACIEFQKSIEGEESNELRKLLLENEYLEEEIHKLNQTYTSFKSSVSALSNEILEDLYNSSSALETEIHEGNAENEKLLKEIEDLRSTLLAAISDADDPW